MSSVPRKLIVIHGRGGTYLDALDTLGAFLPLACVWHAGAYHIPRRDALLVRRLLGDDSGGAYGMALRQLVLGRFLAAYGAPAPASPPDPAATEAFPEARLAERFALHGVPLLPGARQARARQLHAEAAAALEPVRAALAPLRAALDPSDGPRLTEADARARIVSAARPGVKASALLALLDLLREQQETGGDLDTVSSAAFYTHALAARAAAEGRPWRYGRDYAYVFVNYHDSLQFLAAEGPADVLMADLPIAALPTFEADVRALAAHGVRVERFEDHHPFTPAQQAMLDRLRADGLLAALKLQAPLRGADHAEGEAACAADIVHDQTIAGAAWDTPGTRTLRRLAHAEDLALATIPEGRLLTTLIKGGLCKVELVQRLVASFARDDLAHQIEEAGWMRLAAEHEADYRAREHELLDNACLLTVAAASDAPDTGAAPASATILIALAIGARPGEPGVPVGRAVEHYSRAAPAADYVFYCYGASLLVGRRLNQDNVLLNLGALMPQLGGPHDGGHAGAAVCRPEVNAAFPRTLLARVNGGNFRAFCRYLGWQLGRQGLRVVSLRPVAPQRHDSSLNTNAARVLLVTAAAFLLGCLLVWLNPAFRRAAILRSNHDFLPGLGPAVPAAGVPGAAGGEAPP